jgi:hypothetical protein
MNNSTGKTFLLTLIVVAVLLAMGWLPSFSIGDWESRPVDMLSDLQEEDSAAVTAALPVVEEKKLAPPLYHPAGVVLFEDFSEGKPGGMNHFWSKLLNAKKGGRINIAYFGDSFLESDILTCDLREMLQAKYGGSGPGWVDCGGGVGTNKPTISAQFKGIRENCILKKPFDVSLEAMNQRYYHASNGATINLKATTYKPHVGSWERATLFFATSNKLTVRTTRPMGEETKSEEFTFEPSNEVQVLELQGNMNKLTYTFPSANTKTRLFGVALDRDLKPVKLVRGFEASNGFDLLPRRMRGERPLYARVQTLTEADPEKPKKKIISGCRLTYFEYADGEVKEIK